MTEAEWWACTDPYPMLQLLRDAVSERKIRLFAVACCRRLWDLYFDARCMDAVLAAERFADGEATADELRAAAAAAALDVVETGDDTFVAPECAAFCVASNSIWHLGEWSVYNAVGAAHQAAHDNGRSPWPSFPEKEAQCHHLRCVFGPLPFRLVTVEPGWLVGAGDSVLKLAVAAYEERTLPSGELDPALLAVLSDALEEAGCADAEMLAHLRAPGPHVRGCWVVDLVLARR